MKEQTQQVDLADEYVQSNVAYAVRRDIVKSSEGLLERLSIPKLLEANKGAKAFRSVGVSLLTPKEGKTLTKYRHDDPGNLKHKLETTASNLPDYLTGFIGRAVILGTKPDESGPRFVGYALGRGLEAEIRQERMQFLYAAGLRMPAQYMPHITLFKTDSQELAIKLRSDLQAALVSSTDIPVELGLAEVASIPYSQHFKKR